MLTDKNWPPEAVLHLLAVIFLCIGAGILAGQGAMLALERLDLAAHKQAVSLVIGTVSFHGGALVAVFIFLRLTGQRFAAAFGLDGGGHGRAARLGLGAGLLALPLAWGLAQLAALAFKTAAIDAPPQHTVQVLRETTSAGLKVYFGFFAVIFAPLVEEILFRGIFYPVIKQLGRPRLALWVTAAVFAAIHLNLLTFLPLVMLAVVLTRLYEATGNLLAPMVCHGAFNAVNFAWLVLADRLDLPMPP